MAQAVRQASNTGSSPTYGWVVILTWMAIHMWGYLVMETLGLFLPSMREELDLTPVREGFLGAAPQFTVLLLSIPFGLWLSRFSPKWITLASIVGAILVIFMQAWAPVYAFLLLARALYGLSITIREPARTLLLRMWIKPRQILIANASIELLWGIGAAFFMLVPVILKALDGDWRRTMQVLGFVTIAIAVVWLLVGRERPLPDAETERESKEPVSIRSALRYKELWLLAFGLVGVEMTFASYLTFWPSHMKDTYGIDIQTSALIWAIGGMVAGPSGPGNQPYDQQDRQAQDGPAGGRHPDIRDDNCPALFRLFPPAGRHLAAPRPELHLFPRDFHHTLPAKGHPHARNRRRHGLSEVGVDDRGHDRPSGSGRAPRANR